MDSQSSSHNEEQVDWTAALQSLAELWQALTLPAEEREKAVDQAFSTIRGHLDQAFAALTAFSHGAASVAQENAAPSGWMETLCRLGPLHQNQQELLALGRAAQRQQQASHRCAELIHSSAHKGLQRLHDRLAATGSAQAAQELPPQSLRELYEWWLQESEQAYEQLLMSPEWCTAFTELTHATTEFISHYQSSLDSGLRALDLPNRTDFIDTQRRVYRLEQLHKPLPDGPHTPYPDPSHTPNRTPHEAPSHVDHSQSGCGSLQQPEQLQEEVAQLRREVTQLRTEVADLRSTASNRKTGK